MSVHMPVHIPVHMSIHVYTHVWTGHQRYCRQMPRRQASDACTHACTRRSTGAQEHAHTHACVRARARTLLPVHAQEHAHEHVCMHARTFARTRTGACTRRSMQRNAPHARAHGCKFTGNSNPILHADSRGTLFFNTHAWQIHGELTVAANEGGGISGQAAKMPRSANPPRMISRTHTWPHSSRAGRLLRRRFE